MNINEYYFINGLIRKYKSKKLLEICVCSGGMPTVILNAINDREEGFLYSCVLEKRNHINSSYEIWSVVKNNFPELLNKWKLYTGNTNTAFIEEIGDNIDVVFIDTALVMSGEILNMFGVIHFLSERAIIGFDGIEQHAKKHLINLSDVYPCNNLLFSVFGRKKIIICEKIMMHLN